MHDDDNAANATPRSRFALFRRQAAACRRKLSNLVDDEHFAVLHFVRMTAATALAIGPEQVLLWASMDPWSDSCPHR